MTAQNADYVRLRLWRWGITHNRHGKPRWLRTAFHRWVARRKECERAYYRMQDEKWEAEQRYWRSLERRR